MPTYRFHLQNSTGVTGDADVRHLADDQAAIMEARKAAGDLIADELVTQSAAPLAVVTVEREGQPIAIVKAQASVERTSPIQADDRIRIHKRR